MREYKKDDSGKLWWCNSHRRRATHIFKDRHCCNPNLGGIMIPCQCVDLTGLVEVNVLNMCDESSPEFWKDAFKILTNKTYGH